jgi:protein-S-isoprenylcysteine O-methyltransferase Ste14
MDARRVFWIGFGGVNQLLFCATVPKLFVFLRGGAGFSAYLSPEIDPGYHWLWIDSLLALQFAVLHSAMLWPPLRSRFNCLMPPALTGSFFSAASCVSLFLTMEFWQVSPFCVWSVAGAAETVVFVLFLTSWLALVYSLWITGFGYQTGFSSWWAWVRRQDPPRRVFSPKGPYRIIRHPVYLSFLGLVWFNPFMTVDRLTLAFWWTAHVFVGSYLKDRRLERFIGEPYRQYQARVPGYPLIFGPLGRCALESPDPPAATTPATPSVSCTASK